MVHLQKYILMVALLAVLLPVRQVFAATEPVNDVRILIDVSGSMKKNDPHNLRSPALRLITELLPDTTKAGVWTFAKQVNMLVKHQDINDAWKTKAASQSNKIHSYGLFTDIEQVLNAATKNQKTDNPLFRRSVILLSDGLIDLSAGEKASKQSRQRILDTIVPRLKKANVAVHTIALSSTADHELLRAISLATNGWYEQVDDADALQRVFLHLFEKVVSRDTVPLTDNYFKIDDSITEMTLLIFRQDSLSNTTLVLPDQSRIENTALPGNVRWHHEGNYDLITIDKPLSGQWQIDAELDPDNRVMVVTDLQLNTTDLSNNILIGETFDISASLTEKGDTIVRQDFLKLVDAKLIEESEIAAPIEHDLNESQHEGVYRTHIGETFQPGRNDVVITIKSATFERQRRQSINVVEMPFDITVEQLSEQATRTHRLTLKPDAALIKTDKLIITAMLTASDGSEWSYDVLKSSENEWQLTLAELQPYEDFTVALQIRGETIKNRSLFLQPKPIVLSDENQPVQEEEMVIPDVDKTKDEVLLDVSPSEEEIEEILPIVEDEMAGDFIDLLPEIDEELSAVAQLEAAKMDNEDKMPPATKLAIGNGIILLLVGLGIFFWRRSKNASKNPGDDL
ncbi:MAG: hypothetical protein COB23_04145 [Methylophaga sp.]|nr:MAG: hypothetical protein COB23_04145 [Methylophaga sp.]